MAKAERIKELETERDKHKDWTLEHERFQKEIDKLKRGNFMKAPSPKIPEPPPRKESVQTKLF